MTSRESYTLAGGAWGDSRQSTRTPTLITASALTDPVTEIELTEIGGLMPSEAELLDAAQQFLGPTEHVVAAGGFGLQDNYAAIMVGGLAAGAIADSLPGEAVTDGVAAAAGEHVARDLNASAKGVSVRMLVAVTEQSIHLLALSATGSTPELELMVFARASTHCEVSKFGASRHLTLSDSATGKEIGLTGSAAFFSAYAEGAKAVLSALD